MQAVRARVQRPLRVSISSRGFATFSANEYEQKYLVKAYNPDGMRGKKDLVFTHGQGQYLFDSEGNKYLDFCAGIAVTALGHNDADWQKAVVDASTNVAHTSNLYHSRPPLELAKKLVDSSPFDKVFFSNSGTEANEGAYKFAKLHANAKTKGTSLEGEKNHFISFKGGFHGRTAAALTLTHKPMIREPFMPLVPNVHYAEFNNLSDFKNLVSDKTAGVFFEPIQGEGGVVPADLDFLTGVRKLCDEAGALLIADEIQSGLGRVGKLFAHEEYVERSNGKFKADMMTLAKPLAGGLPIGAILATDNVADHITPGMHGTTFGGNSFVCAVASTVLDKISSPEFLQNVQKRGQYLASEMKKLQQKYPALVTEVRTPLGGQGLFVGFQLSHNAGKLTKYALEEKNVMLITAGKDAIRLCPPLIVTEEDIDQVVEALDEGLASGVLDN